jgi:hypothetical protein
VCPTVKDFKYCIDEYVLVDTSLPRCWPSARQRDYSIGSSRWTTTAAFHIQLAACGKSGKFE